MSKKVRTIFFLLLAALFSMLFFKEARVNAEESNKSVGQKHPHVAVCQKEEKDSVRCHARVVVDTKGTPIHSLTPTGFGPIQFQDAYGLSATISSAQTIAVVDAYDDPQALSDVNVYSSTFGLPRLSSCPIAKGTTAVPCFQKVNQFGGTSYPRSNAGWILEISLDVQVAHAICQNCNILLVEAKSPAYSDMLTAVDQARKMGVKIVSNSYGSSEFSSETTLDSHFNHPGVMFVFSAGDNGFGTSYPAASQLVTAVGGTTLTLQPDNSYQSESAWSGTGSGCSLYEAKPLWQKDSLCSNRTIADVSADADPNSGAAVFDSFGYAGIKGWLQVGGTSLATPIIAGVYALSNNIPSTTTGSSLPYNLGNSVNLHDIVSGNNGACGTYLCTAVKGYDGPTGLGSPNGTTAF